VQKARLSAIELVFVLIAVFTIFVVTVQQMSTDGVLPGNDPAVHLGKAKDIVMNERVSYSEVPWYPPLLHSIIAVLQIFAGTLDVFAAAFILKLLIATLNVLILLSTYLLSRKLFGIGVAIASAVFTIFSVPLFEMVFWGGYANLMGLAYIAFIFCIMNRDFRISINTILLVLGAFTLVLSHQLSTFVFVLMFIPTFLVSSIGSKKRFLVFLAVIVGGGLALLAWYARIIIQYSSIIVEHVFFAMEENVYNISAVGFGALTKNFGVTLYLAMAGIPFTFILLWKKKVLKSSILVIFWLAVPFLVSQSFLIGIQLPYDRFVYFFATPITILAALMTYSLTKIPAFIKSKAISKITIKRKISRGIMVFALALIAILFFTQVFTFSQRVKNYPEFYERASIPSYYSGIWVKQHSVPDGTVVVPRSPGSWFYIFSGHNTTEETDPLYSRNAVAESVLYSFFEMENSRSSTREYAPEIPNSGQELYVSHYNLWTKAASIPNNLVNVTYECSSGGVVEVPLSEINEQIRWKQRSDAESQLVTEYIHELFRVEKEVTFSSSTSTISIKWKVEAKQELLNAKLAFTCFMEPSLKYMEAFVPGVLDWQNPWDNPTIVSPEENWAIIEGSSDILDDNLVAMLDAQNGILVVVDFTDLPDWLILGALHNRFIDALRLRYELGDLAEGESGELGMSVLTYSYGFDEVKRWLAPGLRQLLDMNVNLPVQARDFLTYIEDYDIKFVMVDTQQVLSTNEAAPALDRIYSNGRAVIYSTKR
jgi:hypothetical protein